MNVKSSKAQETVEDTEARHAAVHGVAKSRHNSWLNDDKLLKENMQRCF